MTEGERAKASLNAFFGSKEEEIGESFPAPTSGGRYFETPLRLAARARRPKFLLENQREAEPILCGHETYRFSQSGVVELIKTVKKLRRPITLEEAAERKALKLPARKTVDIMKTIWWVIDIVDGRKTELTDYLWRHMTPADVGVPGYGWMVLPASTIGQSNGREAPARCHQCGKECHYHAGDAPIIGGKMKPNNLLANEWARLVIEEKTKAPNSPLAESILSLFGGRVVGVEKSYTLCSSCIPKRFTYCSHCHKIHRDWVTSVALKPFDPMIRAYRNSEMPKALFPRMVPTGRKDDNGNPGFVQKPEHAEVRIAELIYMIGRATVCKTPSSIYARNISYYLEEMKHLYEWWQDFGK